MSNVEYRIRVASLGDLRRIARLESRLFRLEGPWTLADLRRDFALPGRRYLICEVEGRIIGYASGALERSPSDLHQVLEVSALAVHDEYQGRGLGRRLLCAVLAWASEEGAASAVLQVRTENAPAMKLYRSVGFRVTAELGEFYASGLDAYEMRAALPTLAAIPVS